MLINKLKIVELKETYEIVGLRYCTDTPETYSVSYEWSDGVKTDVALHGLSVIDSESPNYEELIAQYSHLGALYIVCGSMVEYGTDEGETVITPEHSIKLK